MRQIEGICKLCGKKTMLTYEHVPPESAFNDVPVKEFPAEEYLKAVTGQDGRMPWDFDGLHGKINQKGEGGYYLCDHCNNNTGSWYITEYVEIARIFHCIITSEKLKPGTNNTFNIKRMHPLRFFKAAMTLFCDIGNQCFGDDNLRNYLLQKESTDFNTEKYYVTLCMISPNMRRVNGYAAIGLDRYTVFLSELLCYPIGISLYIDKPKEYTPPGLCINDFANCKYDDECPVDFVGLPYYEINSILPGDYRQKNEFSRIEIKKDGI
jgi:hypothetical protein